MRLPSVDRGECLVGQFGAQPDFRVSETDERPQQLRRIGQVLGRRDDLAGNPVVKQHLDLHCAPAQRVAGAVVGAKPQQGLEQAAVIWIVEPGSTRRAKTDPRAGQGPSNPIVAVGIRFHPRAVPG